MKYAETVDGWRADELLAGTEQPVSIYNVKVGEGTTLERGDLICAGSFSGEFAPVSSAGDAAKVLMIAADDFTADSLSTVTRAYASGVFSREKVNSGSVSIAAFEPELRKQNILLRCLQES